MGISLGGILKTLGGAASAFIPGAGPWVALANGLISANEVSGNANKQRRLADILAQRERDWQSPLLERQKNVALSYDPKKSVEDAISYVNELSKKNFMSNAEALRANFGIPGENSSEFNVRQNEVQRQAFNPISELAFNASLASHQIQQQMLSNVLASRSGSAFSSAVANQQQIAQMAAENAAAAGGGLSTTLANAFDRLVSRPRGTPKGKGVDTSEIVGGNNSMDPTNQGRVGSKGAALSSSPSLAPVDYSAIRWWR